MKRRSAKQIARDNFNKEVKKSAEEAQRLINAHVERILTNYQKCAFNLAIKHAETIKQIKEEIKLEKKINDN